ncbi:hypothetical protein J6590_079942 [Homalodisca vitripennis]|nr:hypothetical protein J6590_079942 [Homalodisca vitripennis]
MELFWTNEKAAMAARPRPLPPSPPPSHTPRPLLDPLRRPPANGRAASPPPYESDGGRAMADGVMADEQKFVSPAAGIRTRTPTNARLCAWRRDMAVRAARGARRSTSPIITTQMCIPTALLPLSVTDAGAHSNDSNNNYTDVHSTSSVHTGESAIYRCSGYRTLPERYINRAADRWPVINRAALHCGKPASYLFT